MRVGCPTPLSNTRIDSHAGDQAWLVCELGIP